MASRLIDPDKSSVTLRTKAKGLLSRLAHDLEILARGFTGTVELEADEWSAELTFPVRELEVVGVVKKGEVERDVLSRSDVAEIHRKIREEVFTGDQVIVQGKGDRRRGRLTVRAPSGSQELSVSLDTSERSGGELCVIAKTVVSLRRLGIAEVKAPLGAFKVADEVTVSVWLVLALPKSEAV